MALDWVTSPAIWVTLTNKGIKDKLKYMALCSIFNSCIFACTATSQEQSQLLRKDQYHFLFYRFRQKEEQIDNIINIVHYHYQRAIVTKDVLLPYFILFSALIFLSPNNLNVYFWHCQFPVFIFLLASLPVLLLYMLSSPHQVFACVY